MKPLWIALALTSIFSENLYAADHQHHDRGPYVSAIKSLSSEDIDSLRQGKGWNLAKPAELNGYPGPRHVLDIGEALNLSPQQRSAMTRLFEQMRSRAIAAGERYLEAERQLEQGFRDQQLDPDGLRTLLDASGRAWAELRFVHLSTHLQATSLLSSQQITSYNRQRGYEGGSGAHHQH